MRPLTCGDDCGASGGGGCGCGDGDGRGGGVNGPPGLPPAEGWATLRELAAVIHCAADAPVTRALAPVATAATPVALPGLAAGLVAHASDGGPRHLSSAGAAPAAMLLGALLGSALDRALTGAPDWAPAAV